GAPGAVCRGRGDVAVPRPGALQERDDAVGRDRGGDGEVVVGPEDANLAPVPAAVGVDADRRAPLLPEDAGAGGRDRKSGGVAVAAEPVSADSRLRRAQDRDVRKHAPGMPGVVAPVDDLALEPVAGLAVAEEQP